MGEMDSRTLTPMAGTAPVRSTRTCPKCSRECSSSESACARCGLAIANFGRFALDTDPPGLELACSDCLEDWSQVALHDHALEVAATLHRLPSLARRYRTRLLAGPDPVAERRLQQIAVLIETATKAQAREGHSARFTRFVWVLGYAVAIAVVSASAWVLMLALKHRQ